VPVALEELGELLVGDAGEDGGVGDLVAVQVEDGEDGSVVDGVEELIGVPAGGQRPGLGFPVADDACGYQISVVEDCAVSMKERVTEFATFVNRAGCFRRDVAWNAAGK